MIGAVASHEFTWKPCPAPERAYALQAGQKAIGSLRWLGAGLVSADVLRRHQWVLQATGSGQVTLHEGPDSSACAHLLISPRRSVLSADDGLRFHWAPQNLLATRWAVIDLDGRLFVSFQMPGFLSPTIIRVGAEVRAGGWPLLPLALVVGGYLMAEEIEREALIVAAPAMQA